MTRFALSAALAATASILAAVPAAAEEVRVQVPYADLDIASPAGAEVLAQRIKSACERPDIRNLQAMTAWQQCKDSALTSAMEQLNSQGVPFDSAAFVAG